MDTEQILAAFTKLKDGFVRHDGAVIREIMTPDGILITPFYRAAFSVDDIVSHLQVFDIKSHDSHGLKVDIIDRGTALMTLHTSFDGAFDEKPLPSWVFASAVWVKDEGRWRLKIYQETVVDAPA